MISLENGENGENSRIVGEKNPWIHPKIDPVISWPLSSTESQFFQLFLCNPFSKTIFFLYNRVNNKPEKQRGLKA